MTSTDPFELDTFPGNPKILFIGLGASTHTHAWIDLLSDSAFNIRLFAVPGGGLPPNHWAVRAYSCELLVQLPAELDFSTRKTFYPCSSSLKKNPAYLLLLVGRKLLNAFAIVFGLPALRFDYLQMRGLAASPEEWLAQVIQQWQPDIIHTFGLFDGQGGAYYYRVRERFGLQNIGKWVLQLRGGSDIALTKYDPSASAQIVRAFTACDEIITDNYANIEYIKWLGFGGKISPVSPVPGTGGMDVPEPGEILPPSMRERVILWPKAYESKWSKSLPVLEALRLAWKRIQPCRIILTAAAPETREWLSALPEEIQNSCDVRESVPREEMIALMRTARIMLSPSLVDGVPNVLYEAMASGAFPILSPLETILPIVKEPQNVLFARNLYPQEIADALVKAMQDDHLVDNTSVNNLQLVKTLSSRVYVSKNVITCYNNLLSLSV